MDQAVAFEKMVLSLSLCNQDSGVADGSFNMKRVDRSRQLYWLHDEFRSFFRVFD